MSERKATTLVAHVGAIAIPWSLWLSFTLFSFPNISAGIAGLGAHLSPAANAAWQLCNVLNQQPLIQLGALAIAGILCFASGFRLRFTAGICVVATFLLIATQICLWLPFQELSGTS